MKARGRQNAEAAFFARTGRLASMDRPILSILLYLLACTRLTDCPVEVDKSLKCLAQACDLSSIEVLVVFFSEKLAERINTVRIGVLLALSYGPINIDQN